MAEKRAQFGSKLGILAATVGSAVGLGNIWRFPYEAGTNGGGAFLLFYFIFVFLLGVPTICAEFTLGRFSKLGMPLAYRKAAGNKKWDFLGYAAILAAFMILSFYSVVAGWTLEYIVDSIKGFFNTGFQHNLHNQFEEFISGWRAVFWTAIFLILNAFVILGGVQKGIERISSILMPILFIILIAFCVNSLLMPGAMEGLDFLFQPDFSKLTPEIILSAMGQAFFSLSLGMGCLVTYASYFGDNSSLIRTSLEISVLDTLVAILAGVIIFPAVFSYGLSPAEGPTLVFEVLPKIFQSMPAGMFWSLLFFILLAVASLTSIISVSEIIVACLCDEFHLSRNLSTLLVTVIGIILGTLCSLSFGPLRQLNLFNVFDYVSSNILMTLGGLGVCIFVGWIMKPSDVLKQLKMKTNVPEWLINYVIIGIRYVAPVFILIVFIAGFL